MELNAEGQRVPDRDATERDLEAAALQLMDRDGVLAGLNLREVADAAGVNRGLVYHYFGSRRELLRAALHRSARRRFTEISKSATLRFRARYLRFLRTMIKHRQAVRLATLLIVDGDESLRVMPLREGTRAWLAADVANGDLADLDLDAVHAATVSLAYGYVLYRERFAAEIGIELSALDERVSQILDLMLAGLEP